VGRMEFGPSVVPELREILLSTSEAAFYDPDGRLIEIRQVPFLEEWHLTRLEFDPDLGRSRIICVLTGAGNEVTAIIDADDFPDLRDNTSKSPEWNASAYHDLAVHLSVLIQEQILTRDPADISPGEIRIRRPADRAKPLLQPSPALSRTGTSTARRRWTCPASTPFKSTGRARGFWSPDP
jgi:hypothetical protein